LEKIPSGWKEGAKRKKKGKNIVREIFTSEWGGIYQGALGLGGGGGGELKESYALRMIRLNGEREEDSRRAGY